MEFKEAKNTLEANGFERKLVYKLTYQKDDVWKHIYFEDEEDAYMMINKIMEVNKVDQIYNCVSLKKYPLWNLKKQKTH